MEAANANPVEAAARAAAAAIEVDADDAVGAAVRAAVAGAAAVGAMRPEAERRRLFDKGAMYPDKFPSPSYQTWRDWKNHLSWVIDVNRWTDAETIEAIPTCLGGWAMEEWMAMPRMYRRQEEHQPAPTLARLFGYLDQRMMPYRNPRTARAEFKNLHQAESEDIKSFSRRVRRLGEYANGTLPANARDDMNREQFVEGLCDQEIQEIIMREEPETFAVAIDRALALEAVQRSTRQRQRKKVMAVRFSGDAAEAREVELERAKREMSLMASESEREPDDQKMSKWMETQSEMVKQLATSQMQFMQGMQDMMGKWITTLGSQTQPQVGLQANAAPAFVTQKQLYNPYAEGSKQGQQFVGAQPKQANVPKASGNPAYGKQCFKCGGEGHFARECPNQDNVPLARSLNS